MLQTMFNIEELLQIFSSASCNASRRRPKAGAYLSLHDSFVSQISEGLYPYGTHKIKPVLLGCSALNAANPTISDHCRALEIVDQEIAELPNPELRINAATNPALRFIDYLESIESNGRQVLNFLLAN